MCRGWKRRRRSTFIKLGSRSSLVISIVMVAAVITTARDGTIEAAAICVGACSPVALRLATLEERLRGQAPGPGSAAMVREEDLSALTPIDDVRATAAYRRQAALVLVRRALEGVSA